MPGGVSRKHARKPAPRGPFTSDLLSFPADTRPRARGRHRPAPRFFLSGGFSGPPIMPEDSASGILWRDTFRCWATEALAQGENCGTTRSELPVLVFLPPDGEGAGLRVCRRAVGREARLR